MDKSKKIMIGAIGTVVVAGGVIIGLILGRTPAKSRSFYHSYRSINGSSRRKQTAGNKST